MNSVNHLKRLRFRAVAYGNMSVERRGGCIYIRSLSHPSLNGIQTTRSEGSSEERWDQSTMEALANSSGTADEVVRFTERWGPLNVRLRLGEKRNTRIRISVWQHLQRQYRETWDRLMLRRGRVRMPIEALPVVAGEEFDWWFGDLSFRAGSLYRLLLLELYSVPRAKLRKCGRARCQTPYFVAEHRSQRYCATCKTEARLESKRKWWSRNKSDAGQQQQAHGTVAAHLKRAVLLPRTAR